MTYKKELLIFGANGALGQGITEVLSQKDFDKIYLFASNFDWLKITSPKIEKIETKNLSVEENVIQSFKRLKPSKGTLFFLYSTIGGFTGGKTLWESTVDDFNKMVDMNLKTSFLLAKHFSLLVKESAGGSICFTSALVGVKPEGRKSVYGLSKAGLIHLVKTLAIEGKEINLSANAIAPYTIDTSTNREWMKPPDIESSVKPGEIAEIAYDIFRNFNFINGNILEVPGKLKINDIKYT